jgi:hypothetical protein
LFLSITFLAVVEQHRQKNTGFFYAMKRQRGEQAVVKLELDAYEVFKLLQSSRRLVIHVL